MAITQPTCWLDGSLVPAREAAMPLMAHAAQRGSLVFDVGSFQRAIEGVALFRAQEHVARFMHSAHIVGLPLRFDEATLLRAAIDVVAASGLDMGLVRWSVYFAAGEPDLLPRDTTTRVAVAAQALEDPPQMKAIKVRTFADARKAPRAALDPEAKVAAAYLGPMLARRRAIAEGADEVVLLDEEGHVAEAPIANLFLVADGTLCTPRLGRILPGITRDSVLALARAEGVPVRECALAEAALIAADEAFLTATSLPLAPLASVNGRSLGAAPGPITMRIADRLRAARRGEDRAFASWLTHV